MDIAALRRRFAHPVPSTVGIEEELMLVDAETLDLAPRAPELIRDQRFKLELPAAHVELLTPPSATVADAVACLAGARADLAHAARERGLLVVGAGAHPFAAPLGELNAGRRYAELRARHRTVAEAQLVCGLHVHVAVGDLDTTVAVHDALRSRLPELAALAAAAPYYAGFDTGLASVRPLVAGLMPRQGIPPALHSAERLVAQLAWGEASGALPDARHWWWELRPHPVHGTLEIRVCDTQPALDGAGALAAVVQALATDLAARHRAGELPPPAEDWRIAENRAAACRDGLHGTFADLRSGRREPTCDRVSRLLDDLEAPAARLGASRELAAARALLHAGGEARRHRAVGSVRGARGLTAWLAERFEPRYRPVPRGGDSARTS